MKNPDGRMKGVRRLTVDGKPVAGQLVPLLAGDPCTKWRWCCKSPSILGYRQMKIPFSSDKNIIFYLMRHSSKSLAVCLLACLCFVPLNAQRKPDLYRKGWIDFNKNGVKDVYEDPHAPLDERVEDLLSQMTIEEKNLPARHPVRVGACAPGQPAHRGLERRDMERRHSQHR